MTIKKSLMGRGRSGHLSFPFASAQSTFGPLKYELLLLSFVKYSVITVAECRVKNEVGLILIWASSYGLCVVKYAQSSVRENLQRVKYAVEMWKDTSVS